MYNKIYGKTENTSQLSRPEEGAEGQGVERDAQRRTSQALSKTGGQNVSQAINFSK